MSIVGPSGVPCELSSLPNLPRTTVLHVVESFAGGVRTAIDDYVRNMPKVRHLLLYATRADAPLRAETIRGFEAAYKMRDGHLARICQLRQIVRAVSPHIIHAHSSIAGVYVRTALRARRSRQIVYTPHCYAFERRDICGLVRIGFKLAEWLLSWNTSIFLSCSPREARLSHWPAARAAVVYAPNVIRMQPIPKPLTERHDRLLIVGMGRDAPQKDPIYFSRSIDALRSAGWDVEAIWIGGSAALAKRLDAFGIRVTGWMPHREALCTLSHADVYLHTARWEGFPLAVLEATALRVPTIARNIPCFEGFNIPILIDDPKEVVRACEQLADQTYRARVVDQTVKSLANFTDEQQALSLHRAYKAAGGVC